MNDRDSCWRTARIKAEDANFCAPQANALTVIQRFYHSGTPIQLKPFARQSLRGGYNWRRDNHRVSFQVGIETLTNRLYFEQFQLAPAAPGQSFVVGITTDFLLKR